MKALTCAPNTEKSCVSASGCPNKTDWQLLQLHAPIARSCIPQRFCRLRALASRKLNLGECASREPSWRRWGRSPFHSPSAQECDGRPGCTPNQGYEEHHTLLPVFLGLKVATCKWGAWQTQRTDSASKPARKRRRHCTRSSSPPTGTGCAKLTTAGEDLHMLSTRMSMPDFFFSTSTDAVWAWCPGHH